MRLEDILEFGEAAYRQWVQCMTPFELLTCEHANLRKQSFDMGVVALGTLWAPLTDGISSLKRVHAAQRAYIAERKERVYVANRKNRVIREELRRRNLTHYRNSLWDQIVPRQDSCWAESESHYRAAMIFSDLSVDAFITDLAPAGADIIVAVSSGTPIPASGLDHESKGQVYQLYDLATQQPLMALGTNTASVSTLADTLGIHGSESQPAEITSGQTDDIFCLKDHNTGDTSQAYTYAIPPRPCKRLPHQWYTLRCTFCRSSINLENEAYFHCCLCNKDNTVICDHCFSVLGCGCSRRQEHVLYNMQDNDLASKAARAVVTGIRTESEKMLAGYHAR